MKSLIRRWIQASLLAIGVVGLTQCVDATGPRSEFSSVGVAPVWGSEASHALGVLDEGGFPLDRVRIILIRPVSDTLKDTTITMHRSDPGVDLPLTVRVVPGVQLEAVLQFKSGETLLYEGKATVETVPLNRPNPKPFELPMEYQGPGKDASLVTVAPSSGKFPTTATVTFTAAAFNPANNPIPGIPISWTVNDATLGAFTAPGVFTPTNKGGPVTVTATTPTGIAGSATVTLVPPSVATTLTIASGDNQTSVVQTALGAPLVAKVVDQFGDPMGGVTIAWTRLTGTGTLASATSTTNASGLASAQYTLGATPGDETIRASVTGITSSVTFTAHATAGGPAAIATVSGNSQTDTVGKALVSPFSVKVSDVAGNALGGVTVNWTRLTGTGSVATATSTTNAQGIATVQYTLGNTAGSETVRASVTGLAPNVTFSATARAGKPASIVVIGGNGQSAFILGTLTSPFVAKVTDAFGNPVSGATVSWSRTGGFGTPASSTSTTDAGGAASLSYRVGDIAGTETVTASVVGASTPATFTATAVDLNQNLGVPIVTGFAYLRVQPSPVSPRVGDTLTFSVDSIDAVGNATAVTAQWASSNPGRGAINSSGRLIVADTGAIIITATRNALSGHARVTVLPAPALTAFSFAPKTLTGITNSPLTTSFTFAATDAGTGVTSAVLTLKAPDGVTTKTCTFAAPTTGTAKNGVFDCALTLPAGSQAGVWHVTSLTINGSVTRTYGESVLALFSPTTLTINP